MDGGEQDSSRAGGGPQQGLGDMAVRKRQIQWRKLQKIARKLRKTAVLDPNLKEKHFCTRANCEKLRNCDKLRKMRTSTPPPPRSQGLPLGPTEVHPRHAFECGVHPPSLWHCLPLSGRRKKRPDLSRGHPIISADFAARLSRKSGLFRYIVWASRPAGLAPANLTHPAASGGVAIPGPDAPAHLLLHCPSHSTELGKHTARCRRTDGRVQRLRQRCQALILRGSRCICVVAQAWSAR